MIFVIPVLCTLLPEGADMGDTSTEFDKLGEGDISRDHGGRFGSQTVT
jgi:hypothetical protein